MKKVCEKVCIITFLFFCGLSGLKAQYSRPPGIDSVVVIFRNHPVVSVKKAALKYNKAFAMSFQMDDALSDIYKKVFPVFQGDGLTPGLSYSDGCGHAVNFKMSSAIYIFSSNNFTDILNPGDPYHDQTKLTWPELYTLYKNHWGIENHGLFDNPDISSPEKIQYAFQRTESYARRKISDSIIFKSFVIPNGDETYVSYLAGNHYHGAINQGQDNSWIGHGSTGFDVESDTINWLKPVKLNRQFLYGDFKRSADTLYAHSLHGKHEWLLSGMHTLPGNFIAEMKEIYNNYGKPGLDNIWLAPDDEILDYLAVKQAVRLHKTLNGNRMTITFSGDIPADRMTYALTLNVFSDQPLDTIIIYGTDQYSYSGLGKDTALVNLSWDGRSVYSTEMLADSFTHQALVSGSEYKALVAMDYVLKLPAGETKIRLQDTLCSLDRSGWSMDYDAGFCNLVHLGRDTVLCPGDSLTLNGPGNMSSYIWYQNGVVLSHAQEVVVVPDTTTDYVLKVIDRSGNKMGDTLHVALFGVPTVNLGADTGVCAGKCLSLEVPRGFVYFWNTGDTTSSITLCPFSDTLVSVRLTTTNGCSVSDTILVRHYITPSVFIPQDSSFYCFGDSVILTVTGGEENMRYIWNTGDTVPRLAFLPRTADTVYRFSVKGVSPRGCPAYDTAQIKISPSLRVFTDIDTLKTCQGLRTMVSCTPAKGHFVAYYWMAGSDTIKTTSPEVVLEHPDTSQWILLSAKDKTGCLAQDSTFLLTVNYPSLIVPQDTGMCRGDSLYLVASGGTIFYWLLGGDTLSYRPVLHISPDTNTVYKVISGYDPMCMTEKNARVSVYPLPKTHIVRGDGPVCMQREVKLSATGAQDYLWQPGNVTGKIFSVRPSDTVMVYLTGFSNMGCSLKDSLLLEPAPLPKPHFTGLYPSYCENDPGVVLKGDPIGGFFSGEGVEDSVFYPAKAGPGSHAVVYVYISQAGCSAKATKETYVFGPVPTIRLHPEDTVLHPGGRVHYNAGDGFDQYFWTTGATTQQTTIRYEDLPVGRDTVFVTGIVGGCSSTGKAVIWCRNVSGTESAKTAPLTIFPNPAHRSVRVMLPENMKSMEIKVRNDLGQIVFVSKVRLPGTRGFTLDVSALKPGLYTLWVYGISRTYVSKIIIQ